MKREGMTLSISILIKFLWFIFSIIIFVDPADKIFNLKIPIFLLLLILCCWDRPVFQIRNILRIFIAYIIISFTLIFGFLQGFTFDTDFTLFMYKTFTMLFLLFWCDKYNLLNYIFWPALIVALISFGVLLVVWIFPELLPLISPWGDATSTFNVSFRSFIGYDFYGVYYGTTPMLMLPLAMTYYKLLFEKRRRFLYGMASFIFILPLINAATRATILSTLGILVILTIMKLRNNRYFKHVAPFLFIIFIVGSAYLVTLLLADKDEASNEVKFGHLNSYYELLQQEPQILIFGQGPGALFYSQGFDKLTPHVEWSYGEFIRMFGVAGFLFFMYLYLYPAYIAYKRRRYNVYAMPFVIGYFFYILIAGTNPLLTSSCGLYMLIVGYSFIYYNKLVAVSR